MKNNKIIIWAPSLSPALGKRSLYYVASKNLASVGMDVQWAPGAASALANNEKDRFDSMSLMAKVDDLNWAMKQQSSILLCAIGGYNGYQLLDQLDWASMKQKQLNPIGHSDFTSIGNAYFAKTGLPAWYGPNLRNLGDKETGSISASNFVRALAQPQTVWKAQTIYKDTFKRPLRRGSGWSVLREGSAKGVGVGGNLGTFFLLQGTQYMPRFDQPTILFLEEDEMPGRNAIREFDRKLRSILDQPGARQNIKALILGRFLDETRTTKAMIIDVINGIRFFDDKPVIANVEIGHGMPRIMLPIGGQIELSTDPKKITVYGPAK